MPTYEYECLPNGHRFEVKQSFSDPALESCEVCGEPVRKVFSAAGIVFKGSGYYVTDSRKAAKAAKAGSSDSGSKETGSGGGSEGGSGKKSDGASDAKSGGGSGSSSKASSAGKGDTGSSSSSSTG